MIDLAEYRPLLSSQVSISTAPKEHSASTSGYNDSSSHANDPRSPGNELARRLSATLGQLKLADGGQMRYFGATSNVHMIDEHPLVFFQPPICFADNRSAEIISQTGLEWKADKTFEAHLIKLYFTWHNPWAREVTEELYNKGKQAWLVDRDTPLYSPALECAILAMGALYTSRSHPLINGDVSDFFNLRARVYVEAEMDSPKLATAQALTILSAYESVNCRDSRAWLYLGMAVQVMTDLGLHIDLDCKTDRSINQADVDSVLELRRHIFWSIFTSDCYHCVYSGRPSLMGYIKSNNPPPEPFISESQWAPYTDDKIQIGSAKALDRTLLSMTPVYVTLLALKLSIILERLYTPFPQPIEDVRSYIQDTRRDLDEWRMSLPLNFQDSSVDSEVEGSAFPFVLELIMQFHEVMVLLHRPLLFDHAIVETATGKTTAAEICSNSAARICQLASTYQQHHRLQYANCAMVRILVTAATVNAYDCCVHTGPKGMAALMNLRKALRALGELARTFPAASRGLEIITALRKDWRAQHL